MTDVPLDKPIKPTPVHARFWQALTQNPVVLKELRSRMRAGRAYLVITIYLILMSILVGLVYLAFTTSSNATGNSSQLQAVGKTIFGAVVGLELMMVCFLAPALTAGAIASERERQTFDLLRTTLLPARAFVLGKLASALSFLILLLVVGFPLLALASLFGGVSVGEALAAFLVLFVSALSFSAMGLVVSSLMQSTLAATVISYVWAILMIFGEPTLIGFAVSFLSIASTGFGLNPTPGQMALIEGMLYTIGYLLIALNPAAAVIASEVILLDRQNLFYTTLPLSNGMVFPVISPWISYCAIYALFSALLIGLSVRFVRRVGK